MKFLVVDDSPTMRRIAIVALRTIGYTEFVEANNGQEALDKLHEDSSINFVITDWNMPVMSGLELVKSIRAIEKLNSIPILMVTTKGTKQDVIDAVKARINNYMVKPYSPEILRVKIDDILTSLKRK